MSYLDKIAISMTKQDSVKFFNDFTREHKDSYLLKNSFELLQYPEYNIFYWKNIQCNDNKDMLWIQDYLRDLDEKGSPIAVSRIGEDPTDCEEWYNDAGEQIWAEKLQICRQFAFELESA